MSGRWYSRPILAVSDVEKSLAFYIEKLGFTEVWRHVEDGEAVIAQIDQPGCELILSCQWPDKIGSALNFESLDPDVLREARTEFEARGVEVKEGWWGYKLAIVEDPDGNQLLFSYPKDEQ
jgi:catechol 2,3-dioxygenase-like lactoylglutathione lyase family enzyme